MEVYGEEERAHFKRDDVALARPLGDERLEDLGHLVHLDVQTALARLDLVHRLPASRPS